MKNKSLESRIDEREKIRNDMMKELGKLPDTLLLKLSTLAPRPMSIDYFIMLKRDDAKGVIKLSKDKKEFVNSFLDKNL